MGQDGLIGCDHAGDESEETMDIVVVGAVSAVVLSGLGGLWAIARKQRTQGSSFTLSTDIVIKPIPLLTDAEVSLYNLLRMVVQDRYLVLSRVPLWSFVSVDGIGEARSHVLNHMALKHVDFVLIHPGSRTVERVIQIDDGSSRSESQHVIDSVLSAAGITVTEIDAKRDYAIPDLAALLDLAGEE